jgi:hypothetical protein
MSRTIRVVFFLFVVVGTATLAGAQDEHGYIEIGGLLSNQAAGDTPVAPSFPKPGVGGTAFGISGEFIRFLTRTVGIGFSASVPFRFDSLQETDYSFVARTDNQHSDVILSALIEVRLPPTGRVQVALVGGPSLIREDTLQREALQPTGGPQVTGVFGPYGPQTSIGRWTGGFTGGADAAIRVGRRVQIVPEFRLHWIHRAAYGIGGDAVYQKSVALGLSSIAVRPALTLRAGF